MALIAGCGDDDDASIDDPTVEADGSAADPTETPDTSADGDPDGTGNADGAAPGDDAVADDPAVEIVDFQYMPGDITVAAGTEVIWTNSDEFEHTVTADDASLTAFDSGSFGQGATFSQTFDEPGEYPYFCGIHNQMTGTVIVQ